MNIPRKAPKMILFDYGHTLVHEYLYDPIAGYDALLQHAAVNRNGVTAAEVKKRAWDMMRDVVDVVYEKHNLEIPEQSFLQALLQGLGVEINELTPEEQEQLFWDVGCPGRPMVHLEDFLAELRARGIRTGVISNLSFSGASLKRRLDDLLPDHTFDFILSSCDYVFRKPHPHMFQIALQKAGLQPEDVWFCGDNTVADLEGSHGVGMYPVWYECGLDRFYLSADADKEPEFDHIHIKDWNELKDILKGLE